MKTKHHLILLGLMIISLGTQAQSQIQYDNGWTEESIIDRELNVELVVGKTPSSQSVSPTGAFTYQVPIRVPKGTRNMVPQLSLNYSSQAGNGLAGYGWGIGGLSLISRVNRDHYHEKHAANILHYSNDPMAWDGNRLVLINGEYGKDGSVYKTEAETFTLITVHGEVGSGADWLELETKDGMIMEFGRTQDSKVLSHDGLHVIGWKICKSKDRFGNYIQYEYEKIGFENLISRVSYTGNDQINQSPYTHINFFYKFRKDKNLMYSSEYGQRLERNVLLEAIEINYGENNESYKRYELKYSIPFYSNLNEIIEYGKLGSPEHYNSIRFSYQEAVHSFSTSSTGITPGAAEVLVGDFNGDGLDDLFRIYTSSNLGVITYNAYDILLNSGTGYQSPIPVNLPTGKILQGYANAPILTDNGLLYLGLGDFNGDSKTDIVVSQAFLTPNNLHLKSMEIWYAQGQGNNLSFNYGAYPVPHHAKIGLRNAITVGDFNGDGADDIYCNLHDGLKADFGVHEDNFYYPVIYAPVLSVNPLAVHGILQAENHKFSYKDIIYKLDMNGDAKVDLMQVYEHSDENVTKVKTFHYYSLGYFTVEYLYIDDKGQSSYANYPSKGHVIHLGDFNGDGKTDILSSSASNQVNWSIYLSSGHAFSWLHNVTINTIKSGVHFQLGDLNGDGKSDVFITTHENNMPETSIDVMYSQGANINSGLDLLTANDLFQGKIKSGTPAKLLDYDGDGALEFISWESNNDPMVIGNFSLNNSYGQLAGISTGMNELTRVSYASIADQSNPCRALYTKDNQDQYPLIDFQQPLFVVSELDFPDGSGKNGKSNNRVKQKYYYQHAKMHRQGKGFLGFEVVEYDRIQLDGSDNTIFLNHDFYAFDRQFYFSRLSKSHQSIVAYDNHEPNDPLSQPACIAARSYVKNIASKELEYTSIALPKRRFINQLDYVKEGDNLIGYTGETEFIYHNLLASQQGNPDQIIKRRAMGKPEQEQVITEFKYGQFATHIPASVVEKTTSKTRGTETPFIEKLRFDYDIQTGAQIKSSRLDPTTNSVVLESSILYNSDFGLPSQLTEQVAMHQNANRNTYLQYDDLGRFPVERTNSLGYDEYWEYDPLSGLMTSYNDPLPNNDLAYFFYDDFHRLIQEKDEYGIIENTKFGFEELPNGNSTNPEATLYWILKENSVGGRSQNWLDHLGNLRKTESQGFNQKTYVVKDYTSKGQVKRITDPFFATQLENVTSYEYDEFGRLIKQDLEDKNGLLQFSNSYTPAAHTGIINPYQYTNRNHISAYTRADGYHIQTTNDASGRQIEVSDPGGRIQFEYESSGQVKQTKLNGEITSKMTYDPLGFQSSLEETNSGLTQYRYNVLGELMETVDSKGNRNNGMIYDELGRLVEKQAIDPSGGNQVFEYIYANSGNGIGQLTEAKVKGGIFYLFDYNEQGDLIYKEENIGVKQYISDYSYDTWGRLVGHKNRKTDSQSRWKFNSLGFVEKVFHDFNETEHLIFDAQAQNARGNWTGYSVFGGLACSKSYDLFGNPSAIHVPGLFHELYSWNPVSRNLEYRKNVIPSNEESFSYDALDRLKKVDLNKQAQVSMNYSANGNIKYKSDLGNYAYHPSLKNAVLEIDNFSSAVQPSKQELTFDAQQNPIKIQENGLELGYEYGPFHQRKVASFINQNTGDKVFRHYSHAGEYAYDQNYGETYAVEYLHGADGLAAIKVREREDAKLTNLYAVHKDYLGSLNVLSDAMGLPIFEQSFDVWGRYRNPSTWEVSASFQPNLPDWLWRGYTGHEHLIDFQLIHMNGRLQDPVLGRMLSPDNYVQAPGNSQSYNRYSYVVNNPLKYTDPNGEFAVAALIIGAALGSYAGGRLSNQGQNNPMNWNFQSGRTWGYLVAGAVVGGASAQLSFTVATSGIPLANTAAIAAGSAANGVGSHLYTKGGTDINIGLGLASYQVISNEFGYLGKKGNSNFENISFGIGALANLKDFNGLINSTEASLYTQTEDKNGGKDIISHSGVVDDESGETLMSFGPGSKPHLKGKLGFAMEPKLSDSRYAVPVHLSKSLPITVNKFSFALMRAAGRVLPYQGASINCVNMSSASLWLNGIPNIGIHPELLHLSISAYNLGYRPDIYSYLFLSQ